VSYTGPDGREINTRMADIFEFRDGKIARKSAYRKQLAS